MTVLDNVKVALHNHYKYSTFTGVFRLPRYFKLEKAMDAKALELLKVFELDDKASLLASGLPYGDQRKLEIARALATQPKLLLLDEPAAGMNPNETAELMDTIRFVRDNFDMTVLLIEHDMSLVSGICEKLSVLNFGQLLCEGKTAEVLKILKLSPHIWANKGVSKMAMLEINDLHVNYGMIAALKGISFEVNEGEVISLIGANGAGKTTTLHTLTGLISAKSGSIKFNGVELTKLLHTRSWKWV